MAYLNQQCRPLDEAHSAIGTVVYWDGTEYRCVDHNDLGVLYWQVFGKDGKPKGKMLVDGYLDAKAKLYGAY